MIIETYIDIRDLSNKQSLIVIDEQGRHWDVEEGLNRSTASPSGSDFHSAGHEVIVERWVVRLGEIPGEISEDLGATLPRTYKNSVVLFRSLYACARLLPAWKHYGKRLLKERSSNKVPRLKYRIIDGSQFKGSRRDALSVPLFDSNDEILESFSFDPIDSPAGAFSVQVTYRSQCDFRIDDSEAFLSSRFMGMDEDYFKPSLGQRQGEEYHGTDPLTRGKAEVGSLPSRRHNDEMQLNQGQAYGSLSTFHQMGPPTGTSPLSALRAARAAGSESPEDMVPKKAPPNTRSAQGSRSSLRSADGPPIVGRRPSVSFMPFKSPSLSASPSQGEQIMTSGARGSVGKSSPLAALAEARNPANLSPYQSRASSSQADPIIPSSVSSSPKPGPPSRYSSSFGHRRSKLSTGGSSRTEDDNSSGKASLTSSIVQPGSGVIAEAGGASSGSIQTDDDNISDFINMLSQKKDLKSFKPTDEQAAAEASTRRTSAALSKFQRMRDSNDALSNSMYSSLHIHRSSSTSSRQLSSVPPMIAGTSQSTSSSPGKPISPHTPHTPSVPSRLSANSTIDYTHGVSSHNNGRSARTARVDVSQDSQNSQDLNTGGIDIPTSPRPYQPNYRRSSSVAHQTRTAQCEEDDLFPFAMRSVSLGVEDRPPLSRSTLAGLQGTGTQIETAVPGTSVNEEDPTFGPVYDTNPRANIPLRHESSSSYERREASTSVPSRGAYRPRIGRGSGRVGVSPQGSSSSLADRGSASGGSLDNRGGRYSFTRPPSTFEEEEPLLFAMSDFDTVQQSRRSLEEAPGGSKEAYGRGEGSGASSRRGSKRG